MSAFGGKADIAWHGFDHFQSASFTTRLHFPAA